MMWTTPWLTLLDSQLTLKAGGA
jgi:hypothetical protein